MRSFEELLAHRAPLIGVVHLPPLPGSPRPGPGLEACLRRALRDAETLAEGGAAGVIIENLGDAPYAELVEPHVTAMLGVIAREVRARFGERLVVGVNALRNDARAALGAAAASQASFVRVNVHVGVMATDQGVIQGQARDTLLYRARVAPGTRIVADVLVKHAAPLGGADIAQVARDTFHRGGADVLIVTGSGTGQPTDPERIRAVREAVPHAPVWVGSGVTPETAGDIGRLVHGAIVGTALHRDADLTAPLELARVRAMVGALRGG